MENQKPEENKLEETKTEQKQKTQEELDYEEQLKKRLEELRKRDPFIYR